ncbi:hypothetical protein A3J20_04840 [Candidatus Gottesmanbacteria bacterium RIFCSPLOWO2_02_FULL_42_29]|uniref:SipW-cognate class signal peptide n=2 Tax=Candidatus Gottesmaniibacteriota TaxID=1752720 RepID=A0A1F6BGD8_9BACT|nr:MAG: hypothetical protein UV09_C0017G0021 [Candidatus Gottesmanbacteria bacterium GW2011_GWA2_42_18]KKS75379.1 MAG: hypothetical protein UV46_C0020G0005 [Candidatus Gottesmanbacteria bacterium GW2011_GWC2_42_8]OGG11049.1 MAG: hypothetical protein A2781_04245 [Candidatus Gottesmanbacteria bacterium RIFCSPHIGHO2_01_FULL_42_27]OGG19755.1 MAG: hypothetical protein A3E72_03830 [Candidatus Gottesmanbacteria bacterium RIFCSPHIGHO2_12_FULL_43_26]OGG32854.1 MAG: hypothetical protein A3G68_06560 [Cand
MNRKILISGLSILSALGIMAAATFAYFSDTGQSTGNTFSTGILDLELADGDQQFTTGNVTASFGGSLSPGTCTGNKTLTLRNNGTVAGDHAEMTVANTVTDNLLAATPDMDYYLAINNLTYDGVSVVSQMTDSNTNGYPDLADWASGTGLDDLSLTSVGGLGKDLVLDVCLASAAPNEIQSDSVESVFTVTLNQDASL